MSTSVIAPLSARRSAREESAEEPLELTLFGPLAARRGGQPFPLRLSQHATRLLAYLLLNRERTLTREHVAFTLFPDDDEADARANLRRKLHLLQRALPDAREAWIVTTASSVSWNTAAPYRLDIAEFERLGASGDTLAEADALYGGDLLVDLYDDWIVRERDRLRTLASNNLLALVARNGQRRDFPTAIRFAQRLRALDPWREDAVRTLIALRYEAGDRAGALTEYERFRAGLEAEMGVEPMPETVCAYERVLAYATLPAAQGDVRGGADSRSASGLPFVDREREMGELRAAWNDASNGTGRSVLVVGEAGIGKSRLIDEFAHVADANGGRVLRGGTTPFELAPYQAFSEALRGALPMLRETSIEPLWLSVLATLVPQLAVAFPQLGRLIALDAEPERTRLFEAVDVAVGALCAARPVVLILEDLHWAGAATIALLDHVVRYAPRHRMLVLATYREDDLPRAHPLRSLRRRLERERLLTALALGPLDIPAIEAIVGQFVDDERSERATIARYLFESSDGNPFFLGEVVANDREAGLLDDTARHWHARHTPRDSPPSLASTLNARLERLSVRARAVAEIAAVIGRSFSAELVREVTGVDERTTLDGLGELIDRRLIREVDAGGSDFAFSHQLIQQTVYSELSPEARKRRHRRVGNVIEELYSDGLEQFAGELASHFDRANEAERAAHYYCLAGRHALSLYGNDEAKAFTSRARELTANSLTRFRAIEIFEEASRRLAERSAQRDSIAQLIALARKLDDPELMREAVRRQIVLANDCADREQQRVALDELERLTAHAGGAWEAILAQLKGSYLTAIGSYREARTVLAAALTEPLARDDPRTFVECRCALVELAGFEGRVTEVRDFLRELPAFERAYDSVGVVTLLETACAAASKIQDNEALAACAQRLLDHCRSIGYRKGEAAAYHFAGRAAFRLFDIAKARVDLARAAEIFKSIGQRLREVNALSDIAWLATTVGRFDEAIAQFEAADAIARSISYGFGHVSCINNVSYVAYLKGDFELARSTALRALETANLIDAPSARAHALVSVGVAERELGDLEAAVAHLREGTALERSLNETIALGEDLCELILALLHSKKIDEAKVTADEVLALAENSLQKLSHPQFLLWAVAVVRRAAGDDFGSRTLLGRARITLEELEAAIPDAQSRATFRSLRYNRYIDEAFDHDRWEF